MVEYYYTRNNNKPDTNFYFCSLSFTCFICCHCISDTIISTVNIDTLHDKTEYQAVSEATQHAHNNVEIIKADNFEFQGSMETHYNYHYFLILEKIIQ